MAEAKERNLTPAIPSDMQSLMKRCENLEKEVRSLKLNLAFMNRYVQTQHWGMLVQEHATTLSMFPSLFTTYYVTINSVKQFWDFSSRLWYCEPYSCSDNEMVKQSWLVTNWSFCIITERILNRLHKLKSCRSRMRIWSRKKSAFLEKSRGSFQNLESFRYCCYLAASNVLL